MKAHSIKGESPEEIQIAINGLINGGFHPTLALVFSSVYRDRGKIRTILSKHNISIFGATAPGEFIDGELEDKAIVVMLLDMDRKNFKVLFKESGIGKDKENAQYIARKGLEAFGNPVFVVSGSNLEADGEMIIQGIIDQCGPDVKIFGGMAGNQPQEWSGDIFVFTNEAESDFGIASLIFDGDKISTYGMASCGWKAMGTTKIVTESDGCWVQKIDNEPALDMLIKYLGIEYKLSEKEFDPIPEIGSDYPLQVERADGGFVMRTPMSANWKERSFMCAGTVAQGSKIRFSLPADLNVIQAVIAENEAAKENHFPDAEALVVFSCYARRASFGPLIEKEVQGIKDIWDIPMAGLFTFGEFGKATRGGQEFHNITCSWVALKEK